MHPPAGGIAGSVGLTAPKVEPLLPRDAPRRIPRTEATGVMPSNHGRRRRRLFAALPPAPLLLPPLALLLLSAPLPAASGPITCPRGSTWDSRLESCRACSLCSDSRAPYVVVPCEPHRDTQCGPLAALGIDWSFAAAGARQQQQRRGGRRPEGGAARSRLAPVATPPPLRLVTRTQPPPPPPDPSLPTLHKKKHQHLPRPRTQEAAPGARVVSPEVAARLMDLEALPSGLRGDLFLLREPPGPVRRGGPADSGPGADEAAWGWRHWVAAGVSMAVVCALVLVLAPSALKGLRRRCSHPGSKGRHREKTEGHHNKIVKSDKAFAKSSQRTGDKRRSFHSSSHHTLCMDELLASGWGSRRQESKNVYVEDSPGGGEKLLPPSNSLVLVASMSPGLVQSVRTELQEDSKHMKLSTNCLGLDCASRTMFIGRSSAV